MLVAIERDVTDLGRRIKEIDPALSLFFNTESQKFEVYDLASRMPFVLAADELDCRILARLRAASLANRGRKVLLDVDEAESRRNQMVERSRRRMAENIAEDLKWAGKRVSGYGGIE